MNLRTITLAGALAALALFAFANWAAFSTPATLSLGFTAVQAPLGLVMLAITALLSALFLVYILYQQAGVIVEARRYARELKGHRELADKAEASRFTELRAFIEAESHRLEAQQAAATRELGARIEQAQQALLAELQAAAGGLSAHLGEVEDKLDRALAPPRG